MKLLICADMEGITGVVNWDHVTFGKDGYQRFRKMMTADVNAAIAGALQAGVEDILVSDGHDTKTNILIEELDPHARLNSGTHSPYMMVQGIEEGVDCVFFIGHHPRAGAQGALLGHTMSARVVGGVWLNERSVGEIGIYASICGHYGVPVLLVSGEQAACDEGVDWIPGVATVPVKKASSFQSADCLPPARTHEMIRTAARQAILGFNAGQAPAPLRALPPVKITIAFLRTVMADSAALLPGAVRLDGSQVAFTAPDMPSAYHAARSMISLAG
jgi:D-amino peptidase